MRKNSSIKNKDLKNLIRKKGKLNIIEKLFENSKEGIEKLNIMLNVIDKIASPLLKEARIKDLKNGNYESNDEKNKDENRIPIVKIQVPNFPKELRMVDTPGLSIKNMERNMTRMLNEEFNGFNIFIFLKDIKCEVSYNFDYNILRNVNDYGSPIVYSFYTKGNDFIENLKKIKEKEKNGDWDEREEANTDLDKLLNYNHEFFKHLKELKEKNIYFRKVIPIIDKTNKNEDVNTCIQKFLDDAKEQIEKYGEICLEVSNKRKLSNLISKANDQYSSNFLISKEQLTKMKENYTEINIEREKE